MSFVIEPATGGVTAPDGFRSAALHCGIKAKPGALDLTVLAADARRHGRGPLHHQSRARPRRSSCRSAISSRAADVARAVVVNSGCANACTGEDGMANAAPDGGRNRRRRSAARPRRCWSRPPASSASA